MFSFRVQTVGKKWNYCDLILNFIKFAIPNQSHTNQSVSWPVQKGRLNKLKFLGFSIVELLDIGASALNYKDEVGPMNTNVPVR